MNMRLIPVVFLFAAALLSGCGRHPAAGVWATDQDNAYGIKRLRVGFDGRAEFETTKPEPASWHCFWGATGKYSASLQCRSSAQPEVTRNFVLTVSEPGEGRLQARLMHGAETAAIFVLLDENPTPVVKPFNPE